MNYTKHNKPTNSKNSDNENFKNNHEDNNFTSHDHHPIEKDEMNRPHFDFDMVKKLSLRELQTYIKKLKDFNTHNVGNKELLLCDLMKFFNESYCIKISGILEIIQDNYGFLRYL